MISFNNDEIDKLWAESEPWQRACSNFLGEINNNYPKKQENSTYKEN